MTRCDFFVATWNGTDAERLLPFLYFVSGVDENSDDCVLYGARGKRGKFGTAGVWNNGMVLLAASGAASHDVALSVRSIDVEHRSIARLDLQITLPYAGADEQIAALKPSRRYKAVRYESLGARGVTLYVGAPSSAARLRVYNKTAESGDRAPNGDELVRYEIQTRDKYADAAYRALITGAEDEYLLHWIRKMIDAPNAINILSGRIRAGEGVTLWEDYPEANWIERRKRWVEQCVIPALRKLLATDPDYLDVVYSRLKEPLNVGDIF